MFCYSTSVREKANLIRSNFTLIIIGNSDRKHHTSNIGENLLTIIKREWIEEGKEGRSKNKENILTIIIIYHFSAIFDINKNDFSRCLVRFGSLHLQQQLLFVVVVLVTAFPETIYWNNHICVLKKYVVESESQLKRGEGERKEMSLTTLLFFTFLLMLLLIYDITLFICLNNILHYEAINYWYTHISV